MKSRKYFTTRVLILFVTFTSLGFVHCHNDISLILRRNQIQKGNELIQKLENYRLNNSLPKDHDWETFSDLGFLPKGEGYQPMYQRLSSSDYQLIFVEGFDGPYLFYNSKDKIWKIGFPKFSLPN